MRKRKPWEPNPETIYEDLLALAYPPKPERVVRPKVSPREAGFRSARARAANRKARARSAGERRWTEQQQAKPMAAYRPRLVDQWVRSMQPEEWYSCGDVAGRNHALRGAFTQKIRPYAERRRNPAWNGISDRNDEPHWLYGLNARGVELWELLRLLD